MSNVESAASDITEEFSGTVDLEQSEVEDRIKTLVTEYRVPIDEAKRTVQNNVVDDAGIDEETQNESPAAEFEPTDVEAIDGANQWHDLLVEVVQLWDPNHDQMAQVGLLGDDSDVIKFTIWKDVEGIPTLEEGQTYRIQNVVTDEYKGRYSIKFTNASNVEVADDVEFEQRSDETEISGVLIEVKPGSGLIKRCPDEDCTRVLQNGRCAEHGEGEGEFDLRIKAVVDDGEQAQNVVFNEEATTDVTGISLEEAKNMAMDALDTTVVQQEIEAEVLGQYYEIEGPELGRNVLVNDATPISGLDAETIANLASRVDKTNESETAQSEASA